MKKTSFTLWIVAAQTEGPIIKLLASCTGVLRTLEYSGFRLMLDVRFQQLLKVMRNLYRS
jgi:hypothetical protein